MFHDVRLPTRIERGAEGGPRFKTSIILLSSGREQRNIEWSKARGEWDIGYSVQDRFQYEEIIEFFFARRGRAYGFRFKDYSDYQCSEEPIGTLALNDDEDDFADRNFELYKTYDRLGHPYKRRITRPVEDSFTVKIGGVETTNFTILDGGIIRLNDSILTFPSGGAVTASFQFDVPVRFDIDSLDVNLEWENLGDVGGINIVEIRE